jgi:hypothetical protein
LFFVGLYVIQVKKSAAMNETAAALDAPTQGPVHAAAPMIF